MRKTLTCLLALLLMVQLSGCGQTAAPQSTSDHTSSNAQPDTSGGGENGAAEASENTASEDEDLLLIGSTIFDVDGNEIGYTEYEYKYDAFGNCNCTKYIIDNSFYRSYETTYEYDETGAL